MLRDQESTSKLFSYHRNTIRCTTFALSGDRTDIKSAPTAESASCFNMLQECFSPFFSRLQAFYQASRFKSFADDPFYSSYCFYKRSGFFSFCCKSPPLQQYRLQGSCTTFALSGERTDIKSAPTVAPASWHCGELHAKRCG